MTFHERKNSIHDIWIPLKDNRSDSHFNSWHPGGTQENRFSDNIKKLPNLPTVILSQGYFPKSYTKFSWQLFVGQLWRGAPGISLLNGILMTVILRQCQSLIQPKYPDNTHFDPYLRENFIFWQTITFQYKKLHASYKKFRKVTKL